MTYNLREHPIRTSHWSPVGLWMEAHLKASSPLSGSFSSKWFSSKGWEASCTHPWLLTSPSLLRAVRASRVLAVWLQEQCAAQKRALHSPSPSSMALIVFLLSVVQCSVNLRENGGKNVCLGSDRSTVVCSHHLVQWRISVSVAVHWKERLSWLFPSSLCLWIQMQTEGRVMQCQFSWTTACSPPEAYDLLQHRFLGVGSLLQSEFQTQLESTRLPPS